MFFLAVILLTAASAAFSQGEALPAPSVHGHSFEILSNSRVSAHSGFTSGLQRGVLSNVLFAMSRAPRAGAFREFYIATPANVYRYDSAAHAIAVHLAGDHRYDAGSSYEVGIACEQYVEAGYSIQAGLLAGTAFLNASGGSVISCPMKYAADYANANWNPAHPVMIVNVFGQAAAAGLKTAVQAVSSDGSLPSPSVTGTDTFEVLMADLGQDSAFGPDSLTHAQVSQLLWAGYGTTPHTVSGGKRGLTIPSAMAAYYLTAKIYLVRDRGVHRYHDRASPGTGLTTSDHRLELVNGNDRRAQLRAACGRLPASAPAYIVVCASDTVRYGDQVEAGLAGFQLLAQARCLGLGGRLTSPLSVQERSAVISGLGIPVAHVPLLVFSCGVPVQASGTPGNGGRIGSGGASVRVLGTTPPVRIQYSLGSAARGRITVYDLAGRPVRDFDLHPGQRFLDWDGKTAAGKAAPSGLYLVRLSLSGAARTSHFMLAR